MNSPASPGLVRRALLGSAITGLFLAASSSASAAFVNAKWTGSVNPGLNVKFSTNSGGSYTSTRAGVYNWIAVPPQAWLGDASGNFWTFCIELREHTPSSGQSYNYETTLLENAPQDGIDVGSGGAMGSAKANAIRELFGYLTSVQGLVFLSNSVPVLTNVQAAAIHFAIWEIVYEDSGSWGTTTGDTRFNDDGAGAKALANTYLSAIAANTYTPATKILAITDHGDSSKQDQLFFLNDGFGPGPGGHVNVVPVPPAALLALLGMVPAGLIVRRSRRANARA